MATARIPEQYAHTCDSCQQVVTTPTSARPKYWAKLIIQQDSYDFQGAAVADGSIERILCRECIERAVTAINESMIVNR